MTKQNFAADLNAYDSIVENTSSSTEDAVKMYLKEIGHYKLLNKEEEFELSKKWMKAANTVKNNYGIKFEIVVSIAKKVYRTRHFIS